jgi:hypothetical protein
MRFTVRRLMVAVLLAAMVSNGYSLLWRRAEFQRRAESAFEASTECFERRMKLRRAGLGDDDRLYRRQLWFRSLHEKYNHACQYPWLSVAPDPPEPE